MFPSLYHCIGERLGSDLLPSRCNAMALSCLIRWQTFWTVYMQPLEDEPLNRLNQNEGLHHPLEDHLRCLLSGPIVLCVNALFLVCAGHNYTAFYCVSFFW
eukprot:c23095_g1_i1 orf=577-879(+)